MDRKTKLKKINIQRKYLLFLICISTLFMSVGYASINSVSFDIKGTAQANKQEGIFITDYKYVSDINADLENSKVESIYQSTMKSNISLSNTDPNSSITYEIKIYNSTDYDYVFDEVEYLIGDETYSNENITFTITGLTKETTIKSKEYITFNITFKYLNNVIPIKNNLKSYLNFRFIIKPYVVATFDYSNICEKFIIPRDGTYKIELWGASGGYSRCNGVNKCGTTGLGAYTAGDIYFEEATEFYVCVGGKGADAAPLVDSLGGFNGGGTGLSDGSVAEVEAGGDEGSGGGGGATDIRLVNGSVSSFNSLKSRIMVASGGAGATWRNEITFHSGGGLETDIYNRSFIYGGSKNGGDITVISYTPNTTQITGYKFGIGANGVGMGYSDGSPGAGGGYYGGNEYHDDNDIYNNLSGGGSSFISGHNGCNAITEESTEDNIIHTNQCIHYSNYKFTNTIMIDGEGYNWTTQRNSYIGMPTHNGTGSMPGNSGNGYAKITFLKSNN